MAEYLIQDTTLDAIADAINAKTGGSSAMTPAEMVTEIGNIPTGGGGVSPFTLSATSSYSGQNISEAFMLIVNAVVAAIGDKPFFAWLTSGSHAYEFSYLYYIPASITQQKGSGLGWFGAVNRADSPNNIGYYFYSLFNGFDPVNTTASVNKMPTNNRNARIETTDVFTVIDLSGVISIT